jgi:hypothetical protein
MLTKITRYRPPVCHVNAEGRPGSKECMFGFGNDTMARLKRTRCTKMLWITAADDCVLMFM